MRRRVPVGDVPVEHFPGVTQDVVVVDAVVDGIGVAGRPLDQWQHHNVLDQDVIQLNEGFNRSFEIGFIFTITI